ncbi:hypothetical protein DFH09DRAFT_1184909 [Mycena vulgaris]|nr:hypothetical protein DFH09DRAFT_1184909 [Mycena vulgaris]
MFSPKLSVLLALALTALVVAASTVSCVFLSVPCRTGHTDGYLCERETATTNAADIPTLWSMLRNPKRSVTGAAGILTPSSTSPNPNPTQSVTSAADIPTRWSTSTLRLSWPPETVMEQPWALAYLIQVETTFPRGPFHPDLKCSATRDLGVAIQRR